jgi:hypothetical protein
VADKKFDLGDYVEVKDRIAKFYELFGQGRLVTGEVRVTSEPDGIPRVWVQGLAYRTPEDPLPGVGWSWMQLPGTTSYTRGSELENTETSAWGRAIGSLGILIDRSIATSTEIDAKSGEPGPQSLRKPDPARATTRADEPILIGPYSGRGALGVNKKPPADGFMRPGPDGPVIVVTFAAPDEKKIPQVIVRGTLAADLYDAAEGKLDGLICEVEGDLYRVPWWRDGNEMRPYQRLELKRISANGWTLPLPGQSGPGLFDDTTVHVDAVLDAAHEAELDAAMENVPL